MSLETTWVFKALWRSTAKTVKIEAPTYDKALKRLHRQLKSTDGGEHCLEIQYLRKEEPSGFNFLSTQKGQ
jgi:hypothetical protein